MAINIMAAVWDRGPADRSEMVVLLALADSADRDSGQAFPALKTIARRSRMTVRAVSACLARLWDGGWLRWSQEVRPTGASRCNTYRINLARLGLAVVEHGDFAVLERPQRRKPKEPGGWKPVLSGDGSGFYPGMEAGSIHGMEAGSNLDTRHRETRAVRTACPQGQKRTASAVSQVERHARVAAAMVADDVVPRPVKPAQVKPDVLPVETGQGAEKRLLGFDVTAQAGMAVQFEGVRYEAERWRSLRAAGWMPGQPVPLQGGEVAP